VPDSEKTTTEEEDTSSSDSETRPKFIPATWPRNFNQQTIQDLNSDMPEAPAIIPKAMPGRNHPAAPKFDGKPASLSIFLDEIEQLAKTCGLTPKQTIEWTVRYAPSKENELWDAQDAVGTGNWIQFKSELYDLYPGSTGDRKYSVMNLTALVEKQAANSIQDAEEFGSYRRSFL
jgi:hypothetical protein